MGDYVSTTGDIHLEIGYYAQQTQDAEVVNQVNRPYSIKRWKRIDSGPLQIADREVIELHARNSGIERLVWSWYDIGGRYATNRISAKWLEARARLSGNTLGSAYVVVSTLVADDEDAARERLQAFISELDPGVRAIRGEP